MTQPQALGVYIFAGGFTLGVRQHFDVVGHFEDGPFGAATSRQNLGIPVWDKLSDWPAEDFKGVPLIYGNPPCAPWSAAGHLPKQKEKLGRQGATHKWEVDPRVECVRRQWALLPRLQPRVWVWESVERARTVGEGFVMDLAKQSNDEGYNVTLVRVDGQWTGLPQRRRRFFFVAHDVELNFQHPGKQPKTIREAWTAAGLMKPDNGRGVAATERYTSLMNEMKPGESMQEAWERKRLREGREMELNKHGHVKGRPSFLCHRLDYDAISGTIVNGSVLVHPEYDRHLSVLETQVLCGYPVDYEFVCPTGEAYAQISKAVMPSTGEWLARHIRAGIDADVRILTPRIDEVDFRKEQT